MIFPNHLHLQSLIIYTLFFTGNWASMNHNNKHENTPVIIKSKHYISLRI